MTVPQELSTAFDQEFEVIADEQRARKLARAAMKRDVQLRHRWLDRNYPATFGANRNYPFYFGYPGKTLLDSISQGSARQHLTLWAAETMVRALTHLSSKPYDSLAGQAGISKTSYQSDKGIPGNSLKTHTSQLSFVGPSGGPDWLAKRNAATHDYYGIINQEPDRLRTGESRTLIRSRSTQRLGDVEVYPHEIGGVIVELEDLVCQISWLNPALPRHFDAPGVPEVGDTPEAFDMMRNAHLIRAWRTVDAT